MSHFDDYPPAPHKATTDGLSAGISNKQYNPALAQPRLNTAIESRLTDLAETALDLEKVVDTLRLRLAKALRPAVPTAPEACSAVPAPPCSELAADLSQVEARFTAIRKNIAGLIDRLEV